MSEQSSSCGAAPSVSLIGLGAMGLPMARHLAAAAPLTVWNRTSARAAEVEGAQVAATLSEAAADVVVTVLPDQQEVRTVAQGTGSEPGLLEGFQAAGIDAPILVICGTVSSVAVRELAEELAPFGIRVVDAPLSGGVLGAQEGRLSVMVGAGESEFTVVRSVMEPCAARIVWMGGTGSGASAKLCNQIVVANSVAALSESFALARAVGIDPAALVEVLSSGLAASEVLRQKQNHWLEESFEPGGTVSYQVKDLRYASEMARDAGLDLAALCTVRELFEASEDAGDGQLDHTAVYRVIARHFAD